MAALPALANGPGTIEPPISQHFTNLGGSGGTTGKGTIGIVCQGSDGTIRAIQPVDPSDVEKYGPETVFDRIESQIATRYALIDSMPLSCGYEQLDPSMINLFTQWGQFVPPQL